MYECCKLKFEDKEDYLSHFELEHDSSGNAVARIKCGRVGCSWTFTSTSILMKHVLNHRDVFDHVRFLGQLQASELLQGSDEVARKLAALCARPAISRQLVQSMVQMSETVASSSEMAEVRNSLFEVVSKYQVQKQDLRNVAQELYKLSHPFIGFETDEKRMRWFKDAGTLVPAYKYHMGLFNPVALFDFDVQLILRKFLQQPGIFDKVKSFMAKYEEPREKDNSGSILQGDLWQDKKELFPDQVVIPLTLYVGDFPLEDSELKVGAIFVNMPALPREMQPLLDFVFLAGLHFSDDRKYLKPEQYLGRTLQQLQNLQEEGLTLELETGKQQVYFCLTHVQAEESVLDELFKTKFAKSGECRFCKANEHQRKTMIFDTDLPHRNENVETAFNRFGSYFDTAPNWYLDVVNDFLLGVCKIDLVYILPDLIFVHKIFTVDELNRRMLTFDYPARDKCNMPSTFRIADLKNGKIRMEADQIMCFVRNLPMMVGDLIYAREGDVTNDEDKQLTSWTLFMRMRYILFALLVKSSTHNIRVRVASHHALFKQFAPHNGTLPPTFHNALHYWYIIYTLGPIQQARPKVSSEHCHGIVDKADVLGAIAWKHQMIMNEKLLLQTYNAYDDFKAPKMRSDVTLDVMCEFSLLGPADGFKSVQRLHCFNEVFKIGSMVMLKEDEKRQYTYGRIDHIILEDAKRAFKFLCTKMERKFYKERFGADCVSESQPKVRLIVGRKDLKWCRCFDAHKINQNIYVSLMDADLL